MKPDFANLKRYASENIKLNNLNNDGNRIVFFGDSITEFWTKRNSELFHNANYINRGISSQTTSQMVERFQNDVINLHPATVIILAGINDIAENKGPITVAAIFKNIQTLAESAISSNIKVILCAVLPCNTISWKIDKSPADKIIMLNRMIAAYAEKYQIPYVDYYTLMVDTNKGLRSDYTDDGLHPNTEGYKKMAECISSVLSN